MIFNRACAQCHGNLDGHPSTSTPILQGVQGTPTAIVRFHDISTACPRPVDTVNPPRFSFQQCSPSQLKNARTYEITNSGVAPSGSPCGGPAPQPPCVTRLTTSDPGRLLLTGFPVAGGPGDIQHMDIPNLRGISRTAPYFMNNTAATLEEVLEHYKQFFKRVQVQNAAAPLLTTQPGVTPPVIDRPFTDAEIPALLAYLRKICLRLSGERAALPGATLAIGMPAEGDHLIAMGASGRRGRSAGAGRLRRLPGFSDNDPMVSPWKAWSQKTSFERPVAARASLIAASTASVPELQKKTRSCCGIRRISCSARRPARTEASSCTRSGRSRLSISVTAFLIAGWFRPSA